MTARDVLAGIKARHEQGVTDANVGVSATLAANGYTYVPRLVAAVEAVLDRHQAATVGGVDYCRADLLVFPCDDVRAITAALEAK